MKKIYITENQINIIKEDSKYNLPKFIFDKVIKNNTSLGKNEAIPNEEDYDESPFLYKLLKKRYKEVCDEYEKLFIGYNNNDLESELNNLIVNVKEIERPIKPQLEKLCKDIILKLFDVPFETVNFSCEITDDVNNDNYRITPESNELIKYEFKDLNEIQESNKEVLKRRLIDSIIQGASYDMSNKIKLYIGELYELNKDLIDLYIKIKVLSDYILFTKEIKISDKNPNKGSSVLVTLSTNNKRPDIISKGIIFPYLLNETIRGFMELFASHGLPNDVKKAKFIIRQADFILAEPFDLRIGVGLWKYIVDKNYDTKLIPYVFMNLCSMDVNNFNETMKNIFANTNFGKDIKNKLFSDSKHKVEYDKFSIDMMKKNKDDDTLITDEYMTEDDIDGLSLNEEEDPTNNEIIPLIKNADINNIDFISQEINDNILNVGTMSCCYQMNVVVNGIEIPSNIINFKIIARTIHNNIVYEPMIMFAQNVRGFGFMEKMLIAFINLYGNLYIVTNRTLNQNEVPHVIKKIKSKFNYNSYQNGDIILFK